MYEEYAKIRDSLQMTDYSVAKATGVGRATFSRWHNQGRIPNINILSKIAVLFGMSLSDFLESLEGSEPLTAQTPDKLSPATERSDITPIAANPRPYYSYSTEALEIADAYDSGDYITKRLFRRVAGID